MLPTDSFVQSEISCGARILSAEDPNLVPKAAGLTPASESPLLLGLDNVQLELPFAGLGSRILAVSLDYVLLMALQLVWLMAGGLFLGFLQSGFNWIIAILILGFFVLQWGYFAVLEIVTVGQTPGKRAVGLRVVSHLGGQASVMAILIRNFMRTFDMLIGLPIMVVDRRARRLGDLIAGTVVIHHRPVADELRLGRLPGDWGARQIAVVESFLRRAEHLESERAQSLAEQLLRWIEREQPGFVPELEQLADPSAQVDRVALLRRALEAS